MTTTTIRRIFWCSILELLYYILNLSFYSNVIYKITILSNSRYLIWGCIARERWWFLKVPIIDEQVFLDYETPMRKSARHRWKRIIRSDCKPSTWPELNQLQLIYCFLLIYDLSSLHLSIFVRFPKQMSSFHHHTCLFCIDPFAVPVQRVLYVVYWPNYLFGDFSALVPSNIIASTFPTVGQWFT